MITFMPGPRQKGLYIDVAIDERPVGRLEPGEPVWMFKTKGSCRYQEWHLLAIQWVIGQATMGLVEINEFANYEEFKEYWLGI